MTGAVIGVSWGAIVINLKDAPTFLSNAKVKAPHPPRSALSGDRGVPADTNSCAHAHITMSTTGASSTRRGGRRKVRSGCAMSSIEGMDEDLGCRMPKG